MVAAPRRILTQGELDGACFLYSLANASQALLQRRPQLLSESWNAMIGTLKHPGDYMDQSCGTRRSDENPVAQEKLANHVLAHFRDATQLSAKHISLNKRSPLEELVSERSVLILGDRTHWYCMVDVDAENLYIACSWRLHDTTQKYSEELSPRLGRVFNRTDSREQLRVFQSRGFLIER